MIQVSITEWVAEQAIQGITLEDGEMRINLSITSSIPVEKEFIASVAKALDLPLEKIQYELKRQILRR